MVKSAPWEPEWSVTPGEILAEELEARGMSQSELARKMDRPVKTINEIVHAKAAVTADTALQLELVLGISASLWSGLETNYRRQLARKKALSAFEAYKTWAKQFPLSDLRRHHIIDADTEGGSVVAALLRFFGVSTVNAWENEWQSPRAAFRQSQAFVSSPHATAAWLRWGELIAQDVDTDPFDSGALLNVLLGTRALTREEPFADVISELRDQLAACGVALILVPELQGTRISGAARWLDSHTALLQLSLRHKSDDHFWFSIFHEAAHLLEDSRTDFVDAEPEGDKDSDAEQRADLRARQLLIDTHLYLEFLESGHFAAQDVRKFADQLGIAPGIVVGRLQRDGHLAHNRLNNLKKTLSWS